MSTASSMPALGTYEFTPLDGADAYFPDQLVIVERQDPQLWFCSAATFRAPRAMPWGDFKTAMIDGWCGADPDYDPASCSDWRLMGESFEPDPTKTLEELGIGHKFLVQFRTP
jgi:phenol/toluene 2-monooxygenase (NADH) P4/A4